jgi:hypothetical protein
VTLKLHGAAASKPVIQVQYWAALLSRGNTTSCHGPTSCAACRDAGINIGLCGGFSSSTPCTFLYDGTAFGEWSTLLPHVALTMNLTPSPVVDEARCQAYIAVSCWSLAAHLTHQVHLLHSCPRKAISATLLHPAGQDCSTSSPVALGAGACIPQAAPPAAPAPDVAGLLALKAALLDASDAQVAQIFDTWVPEVAPCNGAAGCQPCRLDHASCGVTDNSNSTPVTLCNWRYVQCSSSRVSGIMLDMAEVAPPPAAGSAAPAYPVLSFSHLPAELTGLTDLHHVLLASHRVVGGTLPVALASLTQMHSLHISIQSDVIGVLPAEWSAWSSLQSLRVSGGGAALAGSLPDQWSAWSSSLEVLALANATVAGTLPASWSAFNALKTLSLDTLAVTGGIPEAWAAAAAMPQLNHVALTNVPLYAAGASSLSTYYPWLTGKPLAALQLASLGLVGSPEPNFPAMFPQLRELVLSGNPAMSGAIPSQWYNFNAMRRLQLAGSGFTGVLPDWLWAILADGAALDLARNKLTGAVRGRPADGPAA